MEEELWKKIINARINAERKPSKIEIPSCLIPATKFEEFKMLNASVAPNNSSRPPEDNLSWRSPLEKGRYCTSLTEVVLDLPDSRSQPSGRYL